MQDQVGVARDAQFGELIRERAAGSFLRGSYCEFLNWGRFSHRITRRSTGPPSRRGFDFKRRPYRHFAANQRGLKASKGEPQVEARDQEAYRSGGDDLIDARR